MSSVSLTSVRIPLLSLLAPLFNSSTFLSVTVCNNWPFHLCSLSLQFILSSTEPWVPHSVMPSLFCQRKSQCRQKSAKNVLWFLYPYFSELISYYASTYSNSAPLISLAFVEHTACFCLRDFVLSVFLPGIIPSQYLHC